ncbi:TRAP transporter small permease subunit [Wenzhouxiangella sp. AB-CW3]|uniref:TRAP transporter small permease n=1 Tax=Wenzhouxiangella sp. AB-CW3 TaxID=2771012 RepID=UPI00168AAED2|nr:TRAP transporter small permease subunit [Wenzhouxiangella sp. AB-CW3]QOC22862.1 TRAP transporter small permease subunit [Wenzhouxiangella sp. AB-CW3]
MTPILPSSGTRWRSAVKAGFAWLDDGLGWFERSALVTCILAMAAISVANVISRNTLGSSIQFAHDVSQILLVIVTFMGIGIGAREARHIRVSAIHDLLPQRARKVLLIFVSLTTSALLFALAGYGRDYAQSTQRSCRVLPEHVEFVGLSVPVGAMPTSVAIVMVLIGLILAGHGVRLTHHHGGRWLRQLGPVMRPLALGTALVAGFLLAAWLFSLFLELVANREGRCRVTSSTGFPVYLVHMLVPLGFLLGSIQFALAGIRNLIGRDNYLSWYRRDEYESAAQSAGQSSLGEARERQVDG